jgi:protein phosphatase
VGEILAASDSLDEAVDRLVEEANQAGGRDNITVVCFRFGGDEQAAALEDTITGLHTRDLPEPVEEIPAVAAEASVEPAPRERPPARRRRLTFKRVAIAAVIFAVLVGVGIGAVAGSHRIYFLGEDRGLVTLYRGVPYDLPFGIELYQKRYVSSVPVRALTPLERRRLLDHQLRSKKDASNLVRGLEEGRGY